MSVVDLPPTSGSGGGSSNEFENMLQQYGVDPSMLSGGGGTQVFVGRTSGQGEQEVRGQVQSDATRGVDQMLRDMFVMAEQQPNQLRDLQTKLFRAGFYGSTPAGRIGWGTPDELTVAAYQSALERAAAFYESGIRKSPTDVINDAIRSRQESETLGMADDAGVIGGGNVYVINTDDPAALRQLADRVGQAVIGKKPDAELRDKIVNSVIESQRGQQQQVISAREGAERATFNARVNQQGQMVVGAGAQVAAPEGGLSPEQIAQVAYNAGFRGEALQTAVAISLAESRGHPDAHNPRGEDSRGLWQINVRAHGNRFGPPQGLFDPQANANAAFRLWKESGFRPWTTFTGATKAGARNSHTRYMDVAARAAAAAQSEGAVSGGVVEGAGGAPIQPAPSPSNQYIPPQTINQTGVDPQARAIEQVRAARPAEAQATDIANTYNDFLEVILGGIGAS